MATPAPQRPRWLLVGTADLATLPGRSLLTFLIDGATYRKVVVWGSPPSDRVVYAAGSLMVEEQDARPVGKVYDLSKSPGLEP